MEESGYAEATMQKNPQEKGTPRIPALQYMSIPSAGTKAFERTSALATIGLQRHDT